MLAKCSGGTAALPYQNEEIICYRYVIQNIFYMNFRIFRRASCGLVLTSHLKLFANPKMANLFHPIL